MGLLLRSNRAQVKKMLDSYTHEAISIKRSEISNLGIHGRD
jgi:hypothetical protein